MLEWQEPAIVLETAAYGEGDALVSVLTAQGLWRGLAKGGAARGKAGMWQKGNMLSARWVARTAEQLGTLAGEMVHPAAALAMGERDSLAVLNAACALAAGAMAEREACPAVFAGLARVLAGIDIAGVPLPELVRWEVLLLRELGFGLDFSAQAGGNDRLAYVSPRTGRAVSLSQAGEWVDRLFPLPEFMLGEGEASLADCLAGLRITGHFFTRDVFGARHRPLPTARQRLYELIADRLAEGE
ncbi:DNA repair protein RecO [Acidocella aquatica]|uniref:DNA repair protein RecO n=1 Tax=Acidocella aquatica TaxID=1922313 RepID=A0ABQ6A3K6_9PROT|nr:DNA repair protein RecO [Acidocella aquatica]